MIIKEFGKKISVSSDISQASIEDAILSLPYSTDYLLLVSVEASIEAVFLKEFFEEKMNKAHSPVRIHIIVDYKPERKADWQMFSLLGGVWSSGL